MALRSLIMLRILFNEYPLIRTVVPEGPFWEKGYYAKSYKE